MEDKIFDIVTDLLRDDITKEEAIDKLLILPIVSPDNIDDLFSQCSNEIEIEFQMGGLSDSVYEEYARAVHNRFMEKNR